MTCNQFQTGNKIALFTAAILFFGVLFSAAKTIAKEPAPAPLAVMAQTTVTFPPVIAGKAVEHGFLVKNTGLANLDILNVYTG